jgi:hypothetical protein
MALKKRRASGTLCSERSVQSTSRAMNSTVLRRRIPDVRHTQCPAVRMLPPLRITAHHPDKISVASPGTGSQTPGAVRVLSLRFSVLSRKMMLKVLWSLFAHSRRSRPEPQCPDGSHTGGSSYCPSDGRQQDPRLRTQSATQSQGDMLTADADKAVEHLRKPVLQQGVLNVARNQSIARRRQGSRWTSLPRVV